MHPENHIGLYFHWPFCKSKCPYCDFNTHVHEQIDQTRWRDGYLRALDGYAQKLQGRVISSIFFGGGTPSLMDPGTTAAIIDKVRSLWPCVNDLEITLEANPTSVEADKFEAFRAAGVNRVSIGVQSLYDADLKFLGREHSADEARAAIALAERHFDRFSFDLIYARPDQTLESWRVELEEAITLARGHLSLYQLTIERNTPFHFDFVQKKFSVPEQDFAADFYDITQEVLGAASLPAYEVSNHAAPGQESSHNLTYWHYGDYIGVGPGAHGRLTMNGVKYATREHQAPLKWLDLIEEQGSGAHAFVALSNSDKFTEALMMGLRLHEGISLDHLSAQADDDWCNLLDMKKVGIARDEGWLKYDDRRMCLSQEGMLRLNSLVPYILKD